MLPSCVKNIEHMHQLSRISRNIKTTDRCRALCIFLCTCLWMKHIMQQVDFLSSKLMNYRQDN